MNLSEAFEYAALNYPNNIKREQLISNYIVRIAHYNEFGNEYNKEEYETIKKLKNNLIENEKENSISLLTFDNYMLSMGFSTECDGDVKSWLNDGNVVYSKFDEENYELIEQVQIFFEIKDIAEEYEIDLATTIKIIDIKEF